MVNVVSPPINPPKRKRGRPPKNKANLEQQLPSNAIKSSDKTQPSASASSTSFTTISSQLHRLPDSSARLNDDYDLPARIFSGMQSVSLQDDNNTSAYYQLPFANLPPSSPPADISPATISSRSSTVSLPSSTSPNTVGAAAAATNPGTPTSNSDGLGIIFKTPSTHRSHVDPSLIFHAATPTMTPSMSSSSRGAITSPVTPRTFSTIIHSSPLYPGYYSSPIPGEDPSGTPHLISLAERPKHGLTLARSSSQSSPLSANLSNTGSRKAISERRAVSTLSLSQLSSNNDPTSEMNTTNMTHSSLFNQTLPFSRFSTDGGPLSAPIRQENPAKLNIFRRLSNRSPLSNSLRRRVSLSISEKGAAVIQEQSFEFPGSPDQRFSKQARTNSMHCLQSRGSGSGPGYNMLRTKSHNTIFDREAGISDMVGDSLNLGTDGSNSSCHEFFHGRKTSLESLFPELSPPQSQVETDSTFVGSGADSISCIFDFDSEAETDVEDPVLSSPADACDDARDALRIALMSKRMGLAPGSESYEGLISLPRAESVPLL